MSIQLSDTVMKPSAGLTPPEPGRLRRSSMHPAAMVMPMLSANAATVPSSWAKKAISSGGSIIAASSRSTCTI